MRENRKIVPGLAGTKKYPAGGLLKSRFNPARRLRHLNNQPPKHPCFSIYAWWVFERAEGFQLRLPHTAPRMHQPCRCAAVLELVLCGHRLGMGCSF